MTISNPGTLENLEFQPHSRRAPQPHEVEIRVSATGLNFRDVLIALGQYPESTRSLGCECAGVVVAVGETVRDLKVGQTVTAIAPESFGQFVTIDRALVMTTTFDPATAATIPVAFVTAHYGLRHLARLKQGERVLIHGATGGVGQAAIQLARQAGAEIYATAHPAKWEILRSLGIKQIFNSRTLDFADEIMSATQGEGVDGVLNSLGGQFRDRTWEVLREGGCFVELGKREIWSVEQVLQKDSSARYFVVDLVETCQKEPSLIQTFLQTLQKEFEQGILQPLPFTSYPLENAVAGFRQMQQGKHTGKIVLEQGTENRKLLRKPVLRGNRAYLITGGLGGLGLAVAEWMITQGARHLFLMSRRSLKSSSLAVQAQVQKLEDHGAAVTVVQGDVSISEDVQKVLETIARSGYPLAGVLHGAGILHNSPLSQLSEEQFQSVLAPKIRGAWNLHQLTLDRSLDWFILFSSAAALLGSPGQANHSTANAFLDGLAHYRHAQGLPALSINWGAWSEIGAVADYTTDEKGDLSRLPGVSAIAPSQGLELLENLWETPLAQIGIMPIEWSRFLENNTLNQEWSQTFLAELKGVETVSTDKEEQFLDQFKAAPPEKQRLLLETHVFELLSRVLGFHPDEMNPQAGFFDLGMDSLTALEFKHSLEKSLAVTLPSTLALDYPTVEKLLVYLGDCMGLSSVREEGTGNSGAFKVQNTIPHTAPWQQETGNKGDKGQNSEEDLGILLDQKLADLESILGEEESHV